MISQFFEVQIRDGHVNTYMDLAASLKARARGYGVACLFIDRFSRGLTRENLLLSYQIWQRRRLHELRGGVGWEPSWPSRRIGREKIFSDYRIRIAQVIHEARPGQAGLGNPRGGTPLQ